MRLPIRTPAAPEVAAVLVAIIYLAAAPAYGYVRTTTDNGTPIAWRRSCVFITPNAAGSDNVTLTAAEQAIRASVNTWNTTAAGCSAFIQLVIEPPRAGAERGFNPVGLNRNVVVWLEDHWGNEEEDYDPAAVALTTLTFIDDLQSSDDGEILDADIELNGVHHLFSAEADGVNGRHDLQNTVTHELGHVLGLDHTCYPTGADFPRPVDHKGDPVPNCGSGLPPEITAATMYNYAETGETSKRTLEADDVLGLCSIYPAAADPDECSPIDFTRKNCGCSASSSGRSIPLWIWALLATLVFFSRIRSEDR